MRKLMLATVLAAAMAAPAIAQGGWTMVGQREVSDRVDRDTISVEGRRQFTQIKLCVDRHAVRIHDFDVRFRNGGNQDVSVRDVVAAGSCTRDVALSGRGGRDIVNVAFTYEAASLGRERAHIRLLAR